VHAGVTNVNLPEAEIKSLAMARSRHRVVIADASKVGVVDLAVIAPLAGFETLITTDGDVEPLRAAGLEIVLA